MTAAAVESELIPGQRAWHASPLTVFLKTVVARAYPRVIGSSRQLSWVVLEIFFPLVATFAMVFVYQSLNAPPAYFGFVVLGGVLLGYWQNVLWSMAVQFYWDRGQGNLEIYAISPTSYAAVLLGMALGGMFLTTTRAAVVLTLGILAFHISFFLPGVLPALGIFLLSLGALYCLGMLMASLFLFYGREAWHLSNSLQEPVMLLSGFYFPVRTLGAYVAGSASLLPLTLGLDAIRQLLVPGGYAFLPVGLEALLVALQIPVYGCLAQLSLVYMEKRSRNDGKLISRWN